MKLHISSRNNKLGNIPNISLLPVVTCVPGILCQKECYAIKIIKHYPYVRKLWKENLDIYNNDPDDYFNQVVEYLKKHKSKFFRWHIGGDCPDAHYGEEVINTAIKLQDVVFMIFTKKPEFFLGELPRNLNVIYSQTPYVKNNKNISLSRSWILGDLRIPEKYFTHTCKGICTDCLRCWMVRFFPTDILLSPH